MLLAISAVLIISGCAIDRLIGHQLQVEFDRALVAKAQTLAALLEQDEEGVEFDFVPSAMPEFSATRPDAEYFELWLAPWPHSRRAGALQDAHLPRFDDRAQVPRYRDAVLPDGRPGRLVQLDFLAALDPKEKHDPATLIRPLATLVFARDRVRLGQLSRGLRLGLLLIVAVAVALSGWLVQRTVGRSLRPLVAIQTQLAGLHARALHTRLALPENTRELAPLVDQFNALLTELEQAFLREQDFTAAAAHELRTPLAEIRSLAEVGERFGTEGALASEYFADIVAVVTQMETLTRNLLGLARLDGGLRAASHPQTTDLVRAAAQAWARTSAAVASRKLHYTYDGPSATIVWADREICELLFANLLGNAIAYSPAGAEIRVACTVANGRVDIALANACTDLLPADLPHVFERFWRKETARSDGGHAGLGLAFVRAYANQLGVNSVALLDHDGRFVVRLEGFHLADDEGLNRL